MARMPVRLNPGRTYTPESSRRDLTDRRRAFTLALLVAAVLATSWAPAASAENQVAPLTADDVLPGTCRPAVVLFGQVTDCTFPLSRVAPLDPFLGPHVADQDVTFDDENDEQADCVVEDGSLVCRGVFAYYESGERVVRPRISYEAASATATFTGVEPSGFALELFPTAGTEPYVFGYNSLRLWSYGPASEEPGLARVSLRDDPSVSWTVNVPAADMESGEPIALDVGGLTPGRYRLTPCIGADAETCEPVPGGITFQIGTGELVELIPGWNRRDADRINVIFAASGDVAIDEALAAARDLVAWDGPYLVGNDDTVLGPNASPSEVWSLEFGPFAIEPLRAARGRFNVWFLDDLVADPNALAFSAPPNGWGDPLPDFGLPDVQLTRLHFTSPGRFARSEAGWPSFTSPYGPTVVARDGMQFAGVYMALPDGYTRMQGEVLAHEWGHALFDLRDEYEEPERGVTHGYPNCAPDSAAAEEWWGDATGAIDPFAYEYIDVSRAWGQYVDPDLVVKLTVGEYPGGCYSDQDDAAVRPTGDSIMNSGVPVFGEVNRLRAEEILSLFSGRAPIGAGSAAVSCDPVRSGSPMAVCAVSVLSYVDVPAGGLRVRAGTSSAGCSIVSGGGSEATALACDPLALVGEGPWNLALTTPTGGHVAEVRVDAPPAPPPEPPVLPPVVALPTSPAASHGAAWIVIGALALVIVFSSLVLVRRAMGD